MDDVLAIMNWTLDTITDSPPIGPGAWESYYPPAARPFLHEFPYAAQWNPSIQYRDAATGKLLAVHPYPETPGIGLGSTLSDIAYGPAVHNDSLYFCGWDSGSIWGVKSNGANKWRVGNDTSGETLYSFNVQVGLSGDGSKIYLMNGHRTGHVTILSAADGSVLGELATSPPVTFFDSPVLLTPDDGLLFHIGPFTSVAGIARIDLATGDVTTYPYWKLLSTLSPPLSFSPNFVGHFAAHPGGDGFAVTVQFFPDTAIVELGWDGSVGNVYRIVGESSAGHAHLFDVTYSSDGNYLYAVADSDYSLIWRFVRGPGNVGGDAPWMHGNYLTRADWDADGNPVFGGGFGTHALWLSTISGIKTVKSGEIPALRLAQRDDAQLTTATSAQRSTRLRGPNAYL